MSLSIQNDEIKYLLHRGLTTVRETTWLDLRMATAAALALWAVREAERQYALDMVQVDGVWINRALEERIRLHMAADTSITYETVDDARETA